MERECRKQTWWRLGGSGSGVDMGGAGNTSAEADGRGWSSSAGGPRSIYGGARGRRTEASFHRRGEPTRGTCQPNSVVLCVRSTNHS